MGTAFSLAIFNKTSLADRPPLNISNSSFKSNSVGVPLPGAPFPTVVLYNAFADGLSKLFGQPLASVSTMTQGGGAIAAEFGGNVKIASSAFRSNSAPNGYGGALLVGGSQGAAGGGGLTGPALNQAFVSISSSSCKDNSATLGGNNSYRSDLANLGDTPTGVQLQSDGSCR